MSAAKVETRQVTIGPRTLEFGPEHSPTAFLKPLRDSSPLLRASNWGEIRANLENDGYVFLRGGLPAEDVTAARMKVLRHFEELSLDAAKSKASEVILDPSKPLEAGVLMKNCGMGCVPFMEGRNPVTHSQELLQVFEGDAMRSIFRGIFDTPEVRSFDFKWLRAVPREKFTGAHVDNVYMSRGSKRLLTTWIPFGHNPLERGGLCICEGSHRLESFAKLRETYGKLDHERDHLSGSGWFSNDPVEIVELFGPCTWRTADFEPGDVLIFTMHTVHMSTTNVTEFARISADIRWQPAADPMDKRYVGSERGGTMDSFLQNMTVAGAWKVEEKGSVVSAALKTGMGGPGGGDPADEKQQEDARKAETPATARGGTPRDMPTPAGQSGKEVVEEKESIIDMRLRWGFPVPEEAAATLK